MVIKNSLFSLILLIPLIIHYNCWAEYLIVKKVPCSGTKSGTNCVKAVGEEDPNWKELFDILEKNQWPMSLAHEPISGETRTEHQIINEKLDHFKEGTYSAVWVPQLYYEGKLTGLVIDKSRLDLSHYAEMHRSGDLPDGLFKSESYTLKKNSDQSEIPNLSGDRDRLSSILTFFSQFDPSPHLTNECRQEIKNYYSWYN